MAENIIPQKRCFDCKQVKPLTEFCKNRAKKGGLSGRCNPCNRASNVQYRLTEAGKESKRRSDAKRKQDQPARLQKLRLSRYHLTPEDFDRMWAAQGWLCAICKVFLVGGKRLAVDHDHSCCAKGSCGKCVRGLICDACNRGLAAFRDNEAFLESAITYLAAHRSKPRD